MPCGKHLPRYRTKKNAKRHGIIQYGKGNYRIRKVKGGYKAYKD